MPARPEMRALRPPSLLLPAPAGRNARDPCLMMMKQVGKSGVSSRMPNMPRPHERRAQAMSGLPRILPLLVFFRSEGRPRGDDAGAASVAA